jgi:hypothetical protein
MASMLASLWRRSSVRKDSLIAFVMIAIDQGTICEGIIEARREDGEGGYLKFTGGMPWICRRTVIS